MVPVHPAACDLRRRRKAFTDLLDRAGRALPCQRERFLNEAATLAQLHHEVTGTPLVPELATRHPEVAARMPRLRATRRR